MIMSTPAVTLLSSNPTWKGISWTTGDRRVQRCTMKEILHASTSHSFAAMPLERIVIEGKAESADVLVLLSTLDPSFTGDILYIYDRNRAFLSSRADGCRRVMFSLSKADIDFYVDVHQLRRGEVNSFRLSGDDPGDTTATRMRVLLADNDPKTVRAVTARLSELGCETLVAKSHVDAIQLVEKRRPDVVLLDGESEHIGSVVKNADDSDYRPRTVVVTRPVAFDQIANAVFGT